MNMLDQLEMDGGMQVELSSDAATLFFDNICDRFYPFRFNRDDLGQLIAELAAIHSNMT